MKKLRIVLIACIVLVLGYASIKVVSSFNNDLGNKITGMIIAGAGLLLSRPKTSSFIMIIIILSLVFYFNRERIGKTIEKIKERRVEKL